MILLLSLMTLEQEVRELIINNRRLRNKFEDTDLVDDTIQRLVFICGQLKITPQQALRPIKRDPSYLELDFYTLLPPFIDFYVSKAVSMSKISSVVISQPQVIRYPPQKKLAQKLKIGKLYSFLEEGVISELFSKPIFFMTTKEYDFAAYEVVSEIAREGRFLCERLLRANYVLYSPFMRGRKRISQYRRENGLSKSDKIGFSVFPPLYQALYEGRVTRRKKVEA